MLHDFYVNPCLLRKGPVSSSNVIGIFFWVLYLKLSKVASLETLFFDIKDRFPNRRKDKSPGSYVNANANAVHNV